MTNILDPPVCWTHMYNSGTCLDIVVEVTLQGFQDEPHPFFWAISTSLVSIIVGTK